MGNFNRDDRSAGGYRGGFARGRGSFGGGRSFDRGGDRGDRPMFKTTCSNCGKDCEVPFRPTNGKPVYCSDCFEKMRGGRSDSPRPERSDFRAPGSDQNKAQLETINAKLDKLISLLEPKTIIPVVKEEKTKGPEPVERIADKVDLSKVKKAVKKAASTKKK
jgi:CxxC-x17-CxxC domain-containing protein